MSNLDLNMRFFTTSIVLFFICNFTTSCNSNGSNLLSTDYAIFEKTEASKLAEFVKQNNVEGIKKELVNNPELLSFQDPVYGMSLLHLSIYNLDYLSFITLLDSEVEIDIYEYSDGSTPLIMASSLDENYYLKYVSELIKHGANVNSVQSQSSNIQNFLGNTALMEAAKFNNLQVCKLLIKNNADVNALNFDGMSALGYSMLTNNFDIALFLLKNGADPNTKLFDKFDKFQNKQPVYLKDYLIQHPNIAQINEFDVYINK